MDGKVSAIRGVDFALHQGETLAIVGESGSGKSVTMKAVLGILPKNALVESGEILYEGRDLLKCSEKDFYGIRGDKISMILQDPMSSLNPIMRIGKQLTEAMFLKRKQAGAHLTKQEAKDRALVLMKNVGISEPAKRFRQYPFELSGGMRQRIVIAIALAAGPDILICDEPTTALDVTIQAQILELINRQKEERSLSVVFITHDLGVVAKMADRVAVMYAGKIVEYGTVEEIFYEAAHPYTWALLSSIPDFSSGGRLESISGTPPNLLVPPKGDAFAPRNPYAMQIDFEEEPPMFSISETHSAATWLLHPDAPKAEPPRILTERIKKQTMGPDAG
ncbi:MAG: ABC transporter ATP-binding protein [Lachnospiraceae bacterium]|nr:ABC transporter ATP-binding protein [Lachnospiraceae bacterium]